MIGENFPYVNFHDMNLDWLIKIAKDFLDQYTHLQETIEQGESDISELAQNELAALQDKYDALEELLNYWYTEHSDDIADALADALEDISDAVTSAESDIDTYVAQVIADIPADYSDLSASVSDIIDRHVAGIQAADTALSTGIYQDFRFVNGDFSRLTNEVQLTSSDTLARNMDFIFFRAGDTITVNPGSYKKRIYTFDGNPSVGGNYHTHRADTTYSTGTEIFSESFDGFLLVLFADASDVSTPVVIADFDGSITVSTKLGDIQNMLPVDVHGIQNGKRILTQSTKSDLNTSNHTESQCLILTDVTPGEAFYTNAFYQSGSAYYRWTFYSYDSGTGVYIMLTNGYYSENGDGWYTIVAPDNAAVLTINNDTRDQAHFRCYRGLPNIEQKVPIFRAMTYNVGDGTGSGYDAGSDEGAELMRKAVGAAEADVMGIQMDKPYYNANDQETFRAAVFSEEPYYEILGNANYNYKALSGYYPMFNKEQHNYTGNPSYPYGHTYFMTSDAVIDGVVVKLCSFHLDWEDNANRREQIRQICAYLKDYQYSIAMGDMNPADFTAGQANSEDTPYAQALAMLAIENPIWESNGFKPANVGRFGIFKTYCPYSDASLYNYPCDNIYISSKIYFKNVGITKADYMNDHCILWADVAIK